MAFLGGGAVSYEQGTMKLPAAPTLARSKVSRCEYLPIWFSPYHYIASSSTLRPYLTASVDKVIWQKSTPAQIRQLILLSNHK